VGSQENLDAAKRGYAAFIEGDTDGALDPLSDEIQWIVPGESAVSGTYNGKQDVRGYWDKLAEKNVQVEAQYWFADGDKVVVLTHVTFDGEETDSADVLTFGDDGKVVKFQSAMDTVKLERAFGKS
jgi:ketosteroid isomerase-like protein